METEGMFIVQCRVCLLCCCGVFVPLLACLVLLSASSLRSFPTCSACPTMCLMYSGPWCQLTMIAAAPWVVAFLCFLTISLLRFWTYPQSDWYWSWLLIDLWPFSPFAYDITNLNLPWLQHLLLSLAQTLTVRFLKNLQIVLLIKCFSTYIHPLHHQRPPISPTICLSSAASLSLLLESSRSIELHSSYWFQPNQD